MGREAQDGERPIQPSAEGDWPMVPDTSALEGARPARGAVPQAARSLRLLWHHRQRAGAGADAPRSAPMLAQVAWPARWANAHDVEPIPPCAECLSSPPGASRSQCVPLSSETIVRGAVCLNRARTDLWEPRGGNRPWPPDRCANPYMVSSRIGRPRVSVTGTGLLPYIRPVGQGRRPWGLDEDARVSSLSTYRGRDAAVGLARFSIRRSDLWCHRSSQCLRNSSAGHLLVASLASEGVETHRSSGRSCADVGERRESVGRRWATRQRCPRAVHTARRARAGPKDSSTSAQDSPASTPPLTAPGTQCADSAPPSRCAPSCSPTPRSPCVSHARPAPSAPSGSIGRPCPARA